MRDAGAVHVLTLASDPARLRETRRFVGRWAMDAGLAPALAHELAVALSEVLANVHRHAYAGRRDGRIDVRLAEDAERIVVSVVHDGVPFDASRLPPADLLMPREGGYGLFLIGRLVDDVSFEGVGRGGRVVLVKRRSSVAART
ncbi:MAG TPA: ATP-binding protein [Candidatus Polarisedimenticolaceae bacterium]|nr:ATP-binding protein [Candidatus Polarisedimenticolaceae bacterium]